MSDDLINLDNRRSVEDLVQTASRRDALKIKKVFQDSLRESKEELEAKILTQSATTWREAAIRAQYIIECYAETPDGRDGRRQMLIRQTLVDLERLIEDEKAEEL